MKNLLVAVLLGMPITGFAADASKLQYTPPVRNFTFNAAAFQRNYKQNSGYGQNQQREVLVGYVEVKSVSGDSINCVQKSGAKCTLKISAQDIKDMNIKAGDSLTLFGLETDSTDVTVTSITK